MRLVYDPETRTLVPKGQEGTKELSKPIVSDSLGFGEHQFDEMEYDRQRDGHTDIEFVRDPVVPEFYQVKCGSMEARRRYMKLRGFVDNNSTNGSKALFNDEMMREAERLMLEKYGPPKKILPP